jgi:hypothetical protein
MEELAHAVAKGDVAAFASGPETAIEGAWADEKSRFSVETGLAKLEKSVALLAEMQ